MAKSNTPPEPTPPEPSWLQQYPEESRQELARYGMAPRTDQRVLAFNNLVILLSRQDLDEVSLRRHIATSYIDIFGSLDDEDDGQ